MDSFYTDTRNYELSSLGEIVARVGKKKTNQWKKNLMMLARRAEPGSEAHEKYTGRSSTKSRECS